MLGATKAAAEVEEETGETKEWVVTREEAAEADGIKAVEAAIMEAEVATKEVN